MAAEPGLPLPSGMASPLGPQSGQTDAVNMPVPRDRDISRSPPPERRRRVDGASAGSPGTASGVTFGTLPQVPLFPGTPAGPTESGNNGMPPGMQQHLQAMMREMFQQFQAHSGTEANSQSQRQWEPDRRENRENRVVLEEKHFRRMEKFDRGCGVISGMAF